MAEPMDGDSPKAMMVSFGILEQSYPYARRVFANRDPTRPFKDVDEEALNAANRNEDENDEGASDRIAVLGDRVDRLIAGLDAFAAQRQAERQNAVESTSDRARSSLRRRR